jgi:hypothetical protein
VVGEGFVWKVGNRLRVIIGTDLCPWREIGHFLPQPIIDDLHARVCFYLEQIVDLDRTTISSQAWKIINQLGLDMDYEAIWDGYIRNIQLGHIISLIGRMRSFGNTIPMDFIHQKLDIYN